MDIHNSQFGSEVEYDSLDLGTPAWAVKPGPGAIAPIPFIPGTPIASEDFEGTLWTEIPFGFGDWEVTSTTSHLGTKCFRGKTGIANTTSTFAIFDFFGSQQVSFWYKTPGFVTGFVNDKFEVFVDGVLAFTNLNVVNDWTYVSIPLSFAFEIDFVFTKNFPIVDDTDTVFLDDLILGDLDTPGVPGSPAHPLVYTPLYLDSNNNLMVAVDGMVAVTQSGTWTVNIGTIPEVEVKNDVGNPLPVSGIVTVNQGTTPWITDNLTFASDKVDVSGSSVTIGDLTFVKDKVDVSGSSVTIGALTFVKDKVDASGSTVTVNQGTSPWVVSGTIELGSTTLTALENITVQNPGGAGAVNIQDGGNSITVDAVSLDIRHLACATDSVTVCTTSTATANLTNVPDSASSVTLQASNANRKGWSIFNDSTSMLMIKFGATATHTSFTLVLPCGGYYEMPNPTIYSGVIDGIWITADGGAARVTELV